MRHGNRKEFDFQLKKTVGDEAEEAVGEYLVRWFGEKNVKQYPCGQYGPDFCYGNGTKYYLDVERRLNWKADQSEFPFASIHIPARKDKFLHLKYPLVYVATRADCKRALMIEPAALVDAEVVWIENRLNSKGPEAFFEVPVSKTFPITLQ